MSDSEITFWATIAKVQTMADGGIRVYFDLGENAIDEAKALMQYKRFGIVADVTVRQYKEDERDTGDQTKRTKLHI